MDYRKLVEEILSHLGTEKVGAISAAIGFDGCVDTISRPVKSTDLSGNPEFFSTIQEFGEYLSSKADLSCTISLRRISKQRGGNMPNLAAALTALGTKVSCVGNMGKPEPDELFAGIGEKLFSVGDVGSCEALQFDDGKIMLSNMEGAQRLCYNSMASEVGAASLVDAFAKSDLAAFVNWAELPNATDIWSGIAKNAFLAEQPDKDKILLIDLTDCAGKNNEQICEIVGVCAEVSVFRKVIWSMNVSESNQIASALCCKENDIEKTAKNLVLALNADVVIIHNSGFSVVADCNGEHSVRGFPVATPRISVGGGDTFNAGILFAQGFGLSSCASALFANAMASCYVKCGELPSIENIFSFLDNEEFD